MKNVCHRQTFLHFEIDPKQGCWWGEMGAALQAARALRREPLSLLPASYAVPILIYNACGASRGFASTTCLLVLLIAKVAHGGWLSPLPKNPASLGIFGVPIKTLLLCKIKNQRY